MANMVIGRFRVVGDGVANLDDSDKVRIMEQVESLKELPLGAGQVLLMEPVYPQLDFGPDGTHEQREDPSRGNIRFDGGTWAGPEDHELLAKLLKAHPEIIELRPVEDAAKVYTCDGCDMEFDAKGKLTAHRKAAHKET